MKKRFDLKMRDWLHASDSKRQYNKALFAEVAEKYDLVTRVLSLDRDRAWKKTLMNHLPSISAPQCLDVACGTGDIAFGLARRYPRAQVVGLDQSREMLRLAEARNRSPRVRFVTADLCHTGLNPNSYDIVTGGYALRNAPDLDAALQETFRLLRPGGMAAFLDFSKPRSTWLQHLEYLILYSWGSVWGWLLHRNPEVYAYIAESLRLYPDRQTIKQLVQTVGFTGVTSKRFFLGATELIVMQKPHSRRCSALDHAR